MVESDLKQRLKSKEILLVKIGNRWIFFCWVLVFEIKKAGIKNDYRCGKLFSPSPSANAAEGSSSRVSQIFSKLFLSEIIHVR